MASSYYCDRSEKIASLIYGVFLSTGGGDLFRRSIFRSENSYLELPMALYIEYAIFWCGFARDRPCGYTNFEVYVGPIFSSTWWNSRIRGINLGNPGLISIFILLGVPVLSLVTCPVLFGAFGCKGLSRILPRFLF